MDPSSAVRYDITKLKFLEAKALEKMSKGQECLDVNLTILRFYHFHKDLTNPDIVAGILGQALTVLPDTDFKLYLHLLPESTQRIEPIASLILLANHLESGRFQQFWIAVESVKDLIYSISDFYPSIRRYILLSVSLTFQKISETLLASYLHLPPAEFEAMIKEKSQKEGWRRVPTPKEAIICLPKKENGLQTRGLVSTGGGNASGYAANRFLNNGVSPEEVCVITDEPVVAYERPALSKAFLFPEKPARLPGFHTCVGMGLERQDPEWYQEKKLEYKTNTKITSVSISDKNLKTESGDDIKYEKLIIATGARPVYLTDFKVPGADLDGIYYLRNLVDGETIVKAIGEAKSAGNKAVVIGGGYIGMECAAALSMNGLEVTMVFPEDYMMSRLFTPEIASFYEDIYQSKGIVLTKGTLASSLEGANGKVTTVVLNNGSKLPADIVIVGTGARANAELFKDQLEMAAGGIKVNSQLQTSDPDVYAIGDVAAFPLIRYNAPHQRQEHVTNCRLTAFHAVDALTNPDSVGDYDYLPFFYSRVFHLSWQFYGVNKGDVVTFGDQASGKFGCFWVEEGKVVGTFLESGSADENKAIKAVAELRPDAPADLKEQGINFALNVSK